MPETWLLVLARDPAGAKTRLASVLDPDSRSALAVAMLTDVLAAAREAPFARRIVATESAAVRGVAASMGAETLAVARSGTNGAAVAALAAAGKGAGAALVLASDLPLLAAPDLEALLEAAGAAEVVVAPDRHRRGTNALLLTPPAAIAPAFGQDSFRSHRERARDAGLRSRIVTTRGLATDVDDPDDLRLVLGEPSIGARTAELLGGLFLPA